MFKKLLIASACAAAIPGAGAQAQTQSIDQEAARVSVFDSHVYRDLFGTDAMRDIFSDRALVQHWLDVETALARAEASVGIIPEEAAEAIASTARIQNIDFARLRQGTDDVGRGIAPLLSQLRAAGGDQVSEYLHWGSTTQDIMDTATVLQVKAGVTLIREQLKQLTLQIADLAETHRATVMMARSNGQDAVPTTFGLQLTTYMMPLYRDIQRLDETAGRLRAQMGSTVGTLAPFGDKGLTLQKAFAEELGLEAPIAPWNPSRDVFAETVQTLGLITATLGRVATDINNLGRTQIDELKEGENGASSTMPQKRNPRAAEYMGGLARMGKMYNAAALDIMSHTDTRQGAPWILEWSIIPESFMTTSASIDRAQRLFDHLIVKPDHMIRNFQSSRNFALSEAVMNALATKIGRGKAYATVKHAIRQAGAEDSLRDVIDNNESINQHLSDQEIDRLLQPANYVGMAPRIVDQAVAMVREQLR
ncbi:class-II fumarase/aspartase family protein [Kushneria sp. EE4]